MTDENIENSVAVVCAAPASPPGDEWGTSALEHNASRRGIRMSVAARRSVTELQWNVVDTASILAPSLSCYSAQDPQAPGPSILNPPAMGQLLAMAESVRMCRCGVLTRVPHVPIFKIPASCTGTHRCQHPRFRASTKRAKLVADCAVAEAFAVTTTYETAARSA